MAMWSVQHYTDAIEGIVASNQYSADEKVAAVEYCLERTRRVKLGAIEEIEVLRGSQIKLMFEIQGVYRADVRRGRRPALLGVH